MVDVNRLTLGGSLFGVERWSTSVHYDFPIGEPTFSTLRSYDELLGWVQRIADEKLDTQPYVTTLRNMLSSQGTIDTIRGEYISDGVLQQAAEATFTPIAGLSNPNRPPQISLVVSLRTGRPGRSYNGRMYLPSLFEPTMTSGGVVAAGTVATIAERFADMLYEFGELPLREDLKPVIYSRVKDEVTRVTSVRVGNVLDTQRRRRDAFVESYAEEPVP